MQKTQPSDLNGYTAGYIVHTQANPVKYTNIYLKNGASLLWNL